MTVGRKITDTYLKLFKERLVKVIKDEMGPAIISEIMEEFDIQLTGIAPESDPTAPEKWRDEFMELLYDDLEKSFTITSRGIKIGLGDSSALGYDVPPDETSRNVLQTFVYILEGILGEYAWITEDIYRLRKPDAFFDYGRFGAGFLIPEDQFYREGWDTYVTFNEVRFGFSNAGPKNIFADAVTNFDWKKYIFKAAKLAAKDLEKAL